MIYLDSSVVLAHVLAEDVAPPAALWGEPLITSRLTTYETWTRLHARGWAKSHGEELRQALGRLSMVELAPPVLARALEPWPVPMRTLDALHLATMDFLRLEGLEIELACFDARLTLAATRLGFSTWKATST